MNQFAGSQPLIEIIYLIAAPCSSLSLKWMSFPSTARHGIWPVNSAWSLPSPARFSTMASSMEMDRCRPGPGSGIGIPLGMVQMTAVPQRTAAQPRLRRTLRHSGRHRRFYLRTPNVPRSDVLLSMEVILGGLTSPAGLNGRRTAARNPPHAHTIKTEPRQLSAARRRHRQRRLPLVLHPEAKQFFPLIVGISLIFGFFSSSRSAGLTCPPSSPY